MSDWIAILIAGLGFLFNITSFIILRSFGAGASMSKFQTVSDANSRDAMYHSVFARKDVTQIEFRNLTDKISEVQKNQKEGFAQINERLDTIIKMEKTK